ncbi:phage replication O-like protein O [Paenibacillus rhizosphaerae]|uniref:Phage replication O-like protein O n=1 Tax=Paenibacillus rhizosphaerae TaxID=297318 RepID=A0A839TY23_9BACL|nr:replication protein [Paenibacillus rhizosphaerae]MBB3132164.1 phage replication O-like protein O [Paenibacillus rhizosphaerae]
MANVQKEHGFAPIANEILDTICQYTFNGAQLRIVLKIWRLTYGYGRKDHDFSISFLQQTTGLSDRTIKKEIAALVKDRVLIVTKQETSTTARRLAFNKDYDQWTISKSGDNPVHQDDLFSMTEGKDCSPPDDVARGEVLFTPGGKYPSPQDGVLGGSIVPPYKEKDLLKKSIKDNIALFDQFYEIYPRKVSKKKAQESWNRLCKQEGFNPSLAIEQTRNFAETCKLLKTATKFIPHPSTYLNQKRYEDYNVVDPEGLAENSKGSGSAFDRLLRKELEEHGSRRRDISHEVHFGGIPQLPDGR